MLRNRSFLKELDRLAPAFPIRPMSDRPSVGGNSWLHLMYSWHATQEHRWSSQGHIIVIVSIVILIRTPIILPVIGVTQGFSSSIDVLLDAF